jgi:general secretion pathway protein G
VNNTLVPSNRLAPLTEFRSNRLIDDDGDFFPGYIDTLAAGGDGRFYAYFSGYGNNAYDPNDCNYPPADPFGVDPQGINNQIPFRVSFASPGITNRLVLSWGPNPYTSTLNVTNAVTQQPAAFLNPQSYQIISAGVDRRFGVGGLYDPDSNTLKLPQPVTDTLAPLDTVDVTGNRLDRLAAERDNLTNFATGKLD